MTIQDEHPFGGAESFGSMAEAIAAFVPDSMAQDRILVASGHELIASIVSANETLHIEADELISITPGEEHGSFVMRLKEKVSEHKKIAGTISVVVTGSALLAAYVHQRRKR